MDKLRAMGLLVRLADLGSFTKVAQEAGSSKSMISKEISRLEESLGARLLHRSTRNVQLTEMGQEYVQRCRGILQQMEDADTHIQSLQGKATGKLRINLPMVLGIQYFAEAFSAFRRAYPDISLEIDLNDDEVDLVAQGYDLGFRASSKVFNSQYIGKPIAEFKYHVVASPEYLKKYPAIHHIRDLQQHNCLIYRYFKGGNVWPLDSGIEVQGDIKSNNTLFMLHMIKSGLGIGYFPDFVCKAALLDGSVTEVLPTLKKPRLVLYMLYPEREFMPPKLQTCIQFLHKWFKDKQAE